MGSGEAESWLDVDLPGDGLPLRGPRYPKTLCC